MNGNDVISSLPGDVLTHILSFVSAQEAVQTCILSKRWRNIWASVPVLKLSYNEFLEHNSDVELDDLDWKFDRFVNGLFENRTQSRLDTLLYDREFESSIYEPSMDWLYWAELLRPEVFSIRMRGLDQLNFPNSVFSCTSLQNLELSHLTDDYEKMIIQPKSITLPSLKTMKLYLLSINDDFARNLFSGCPSLESLKLEDCDLFISEISSNVLKELTLFECCQFVHMQICCPSLVSLSIESSLNSIRIISFVNMASLVNADIYLYGIDEQADADDLSDVNFLCGLSNVTSLKLVLYRGFFTKELWQEDICKCKMFKNLKSLEIESSLIIEDFDLVAGFLELSPVLQKLTLDMYIEKSGGWITVHQQEPLQHVFFEVDYLEAVEVICLKNDEVASKLISLLGRHVKNIGNITIS